MWWCSIICCCRLLNEAMMQFGRQCASMMLLPIKVWYFQKDRQYKVFFQPVPSGNSLNQMLNLIRKFRQTSRMILLKNKHNSTIVKHIHLYRSYRYRFCKSFEVWCCSECIISLWDTTPTTLYWIIKAKIYGPNNLMFQGSRRL